MPRIVTFMLCLLFGAGLAVAVLPAQAQPRDEVQACPDRLGDVASLVCACSAEAAASGTIWGSDLYTDDSQICRAARHAGVIPVEGGAVWVSERPGQGDYPAVKRNGIWSGHWPAWRRSIVFGNVADAPAARDRSTLAACPTNAMALETGVRFHCACSILSTTEGSVWGTDRYTADSAICTAARHAGVVGGSGGEVTFRVIAGAASYRASRRNGVISARWGRVARSYVFER